MPKIVTLEVSERDAPFVQALLAKAQSKGMTIAEMFAGLRDQRQPLLLPLADGGIVIHAQANYEKLLDQVAIAKAEAGMTD